MGEGKTGFGGPTRLTAAEYRKLAGEGPVPGKSGRSGKFNAKRVVSDDGDFDSKGELRRYKDLVMLERAGRIQDLKRQVKIALEVNGRSLVLRDKKGRERRLSYIADFTYYEDGVYVIEDFKGFDTPVSRLKRAIVEATQGLVVRVTRR